MSGRVSNDPLGGDEQYLVNKAPKCLVMEYDSV